MGYLSALIGFFTKGPACTLSGWPTLTTISATGVARHSEHLVTSPAINGGGPSPTRPTIILSGRNGAYVVIAGSDWNPRHPDRICPTFRRFVIKLPHLTRTFDLAPAAPNYARRFPNCGPVSHSVLLPQTALSVAPFNHH